MKSHRESSRRPRGAALIGVLLALAITGLLGAGVFLAAWRDYRAGGDALRRIRALAAAEYGLERVLAPEHWQVQWNADPRGGLVELHSDALLDRTSDTVRVWRLTPWAVLAASEGVAIDGSRFARRRIARLAALRVPSTSWPAVLVSRTTVTIRQTAGVTGADSSEDVDCQHALGAPAPLAGVAVTNATLIDTARCTGPACASGSPPVVVTPDADGPAHDQLGGMTRSAIIAAAHVLPAGTSLHPDPTVTADGACDVEDPANLGDPDAIVSAQSPCRDYAPILFAPGDLRITGGSGQALAIVDGDLSLENDAKLSGVLVVKGTLRLAGTARVEGVALVGAAELGDASHVGWSACAVLRAFHNLARPALVPGPGWVEMP